MALGNFKILALTHKSSSLEDIGKFFINEENLEPRLIALKSEMGWDELVYLATCNRVEFLISTKDEINNDHLTKFFKSFNSQWTNTEIDYFLPQIDVFKGKDAIFLSYKGKDRVRVLLEIINQSSATDIPSSHIDKKVVIYPVKI